MRLVILFSILSLSLNNLFAQVEIIDQDRIRNNKIRTQTLYEYEYINGKRDSKGIKARVDSFDTQGNRISQINFRETGALLYKIAYKYDGSGKKTEYIKYALRDGEIKLDFKQIIKFNSKGNRLLETGFNGVDSFRTVFNYNKLDKLAEVNFFVKRKLDEKRIFTYAGNNSELKVLDGGGNLKYTQKNVYSPSNKVIEETQIESTNKESRKVVYSYDKNDKLVSETKYFSSKLVNKITYVYNDKGLVAEIYQENADGQKFLINKYVYNEKNWVIEEQSRQENNKEFSKNTYTYDANGICKTVDSYFALYKKQVMSVFVYDNY